MSRAKNLQDSDISKIVEILDGWTGKLRWELLIDEIEKRLFSRYTRQALSKHARIASAFSDRRTALTNSADRPVRTAATPELQAALERIERLDAKVGRLEAENNRLLEQFVRWAYNAHTRNLDEAFLNRPLMSVNRRQTRTSKVGQVRD